MTPEVRQRVKQILREFMAQTLRGKQDYSVEKLKREYPFHSLFFREESLVAFKHQRSIVTKLGQKLYPSLVIAIAEGHYHYVRKDFPLDISLDEGIWNTIDRIVSELRAATGKGERIATRRSPYHEAIMAEIKRSSLTGLIKTRTIVLDILIADFQPAPLYLELKTLKPNLDICTESKRKILAFEMFMSTEGQPVKIDSFQIHRPNPQARGYLAFPYGLRESYEHAFTKRIMDMQNEVLIGPELWDLIGGSNTFSELLAIIEEVRAETPLIS